MADSVNMKIIARIYTDFPEKFGVPRQSGIVPELKGKIVFEPEYRNPAAVRGLDGYSHIWVIWNFSLSDKKDWSATVRPPRLGGNKRIGVFATRSPYRPNPIGLSALKLEGIEQDAALGPVIYVSGVDTVNGTPIFDIKPYLSFADSYPQAASGFADALYGEKLDVIIPDAVKRLLTAEECDIVRNILEGDPRPHYQNDGNRVYGLSYSGYEIKFTVKDKTLTVVSIT